MSLQDFISKYNGKGIDFDLSFGDQCVDLMNQYLVDVFSITNPIQTFPGGTAFEIYTNATDSRFTKIANTPTGVPQPGDIMFWDTSIGSAGHVAVFVSGDTNSFTSFDQNWPVGSLCHEQPHNYNGVAGWLHFNQNDLQNTIDELRTARDNNWTLYQNELSKNNELQKQLTDEQTKNQGLREANDQLTKTDADTGVQLLDAQHKVTDYENTLQSVAKALNTGTDVKSLLTAIDDLRQPIEKQVQPLQKHTLTLQEALDELIYKRVPQSGIRIWIKKHLGI